MDLSSSVGLITGASSDSARAVQFMLEQPNYVIIPRLLMLPTQQTM